MFVLLRKIGESIVVNKKIKFKLLNISGGTAKIGITAPRNFRIEREEVCENDDDVKNKLSNENTCL